MPHLILLLMRLGIIWDVYIIAKIQAEIFQSTIFSSFRMGRGGCPVGRALEPLCLMIRSQPPLIQLPFLISLTRVSISFQLLRAMLTQKIMHKFLHLLLLMFLILEILLFSQFCPLRLVIE